ncbi:MAG: tripartite tricarboxylate transporter substrate binding protein [Pseudomonadota bacterium]
MRILLSLALLVFTQFANAAFPDKPIRLVVPWPAGGASDTLARIVSTEASNILKQPIVIDNRVGASGTIGTEYVAREKADGYTLLWAIANHTTNHELFKVKYDPVKDFTPVAQIASSRYWLLVDPSLPVKTVPEFFTWLKASRQAVPYASAGNGTLQHLGMELLLAESGAKMVHVPYKGTAPVMTDMLGGHVKVTFEAVTGTADYVRDGRVRALAVASKSRFAGLPDVPTFAEAGYKDFVVEGVTGVLAPAGTPTDVVAKINAAYNQALALPQVRERMDAMGLTGNAGSPQAYGDTINRLIPRFSAILRKSGGKVD